MSQYVLDHHLEGEKKRLALMSQLLDPMHRRYIESLGISRDARVLEVACGSGSMSAWMAGHVAAESMCTGVRCGGGSSQLLGVRSGRMILRGSGIKGRR